MPTVDKCHELETKQAVLDTRLNAINERLGELLLEMQLLKSIMQKFGTILLLAAVFGDKSVEIVAQLLAK